MGKVYVGDEKTEVLLDCEEDISSATSLQILAKKPSGAIVTWNATLEGISVLKYITQAGDLDQAGTWKLQAKVVMPSWSGRGETLEVRVHEAFK